MPSAPPLSGTDPGQRRPQSDPLDGADVACAIAFAAIGVWSWIGLVLAEAGLFHAGSLLALAAPLSAAAAVAVSRSLGSRPRGALPGGALLALLAVMAIAAWLASRPEQMLVDGGDASAYLNIGRTVGRHHALVRPEPLIESVPPADWAAFFSRERYPPPLFNLFPGAFQLYPEVNLARPSFFHLFPVWVGIADTFGGARAAYFVSPVFGVLAIAAFWLLARAVTATAAATMASLLLLANFAQMWFARVSTTEIMTQAFIVGGVYFAVRCYRGADSTFAILSAGAFGLASLVRIDALALVTPVALGLPVLVALEGRWSRAWTRYLLVLGGLTAHAAAHAATVSGPYTRRIAYHLFEGDMLTAASRALPPLVLAAGLVAFVLSRRVAGSALARRVGAFGFAALLLAAAYRIWPQLTGGFLPMLLHPLGIVLVLAGFAAWLAEDRSPPTLLVAGLLLASALVYGESLRDTATMPMLLRRFVPVILPLSALAIARALHRVWRVAPAGRLAAIGLWAVLLAAWGAASRPLVGHATTAPLHDQFTRLVAHVPAEAIVVTDRTTPSHFGLSLRGSFQRDVLWVDVTDRTAAALKSLARRTGRPLVVARGPSGEGPDVLTARELAGFALSPATVETLRYAQLDNPTGGLPTTVVERSPIVELYLARPGGAVAMPVTVEIGAADLAGRIGGFYDAEAMGEVSARWTRGAAQLQLPRLAVATQATLTLRLAAPRPGGMPPPVVTVALDGRAIGEISGLGAGFALFELPLPEWSLARLAERPSVLTLTAPTFVPAEHGMGQDVRQLGTVVDWVRIEAR